MKVFRLSHMLRTSMWPIPVLCVLAGVALSFATTALDNGGIVSVEFIGGPDAALVILGTIAASMITLTGIVLTIVLVVVQLAMGQFSPRIVRAILHDRPSQLAIGIFVAAFAHAMLAMREIASTEDGAPVPGLAIIVAFGLVVVSIVVLILYINHIGQSLRAAALIESVGDETRELLEKLYPDHGTDVAADDPTCILAAQSGVIFRIGYQELVQAAARADCHLSKSQRLDQRAVLAAVALGPERTLNQDMAYGFRMLVDIAERSLSDAFDPTTAVQAIDRLHDCLRQLARRPFPPGEYRDQDGVLRLTVDHIAWDGYVRLAFDEIRQTGANSSQVMRRLQSALADLLTVVPPGREAPIRDQLALLDAAMAENEWSHADRSLMESDLNDPQGVGSARDLRTVTAQS
jgi:uncharacterized membrane protein